MQFTDNQPIHKQVEEYCRTGVLSGRWQPGQRIPSTRELAVTLSVNNRTVIKAYETLADAGIIYQRRGLGYYVADDAAARVIADERNHFLSHDIPHLAETMRRLQITAADILPFLPH